jgi:hypothetical protein
MDSLHPPTEVLIPSLISQQQQQQQQSEDYIPDSPLSSAPNSPLRSAPDSPVTAASPHDLYFDSSLEKPIPIHRSIPFKFEVAKPPTPALPVDTPHENCNTNMVILHGQSLQQYMYTAKDEQDPGRIISSAASDNDMQPSLSLRFEEKKTNNDEAVHRKDDLPFDEVVVVKPEKDLQVCLIKDDTKEKDHGSSTKSSQSISTTQPNSSCFPTIEKSPTDEESHDQVSDNAAVNPVTCKNERSTMNLSPATVQSNNTPSTSADATNTASHECLNDKVAATRETTTMDKAVRHEGPETLSDKKDSSSLHSLMRLNNTAVIAQDSLAVNNPLRSCTTRAQQPKECLETVSGDLKKDDSRESRKLDPPGDVGHLSQPPELINSLDMDIGVPHGDIMLSLLLVDNNNNTPPNYGSHVYEAVWRGRTMRRNCDLRWLKEKLERRRLGAPSKGRTSIRVDVDNACPVGSIQETQLAAFEHMKYDDFDDALELYENILQSYNAYVERVCKSKPIETLEEDLKESKIMTGVALHNLGIIHLLKGEWDKAFTYFERATWNRAASLAPGHSDHIVSILLTASCLQI